MMRRRLRSFALAVCWGSACALIGGAEAAKQIFVPGIGDLCTANRTPHAPVDGRAGGRQAGDAVGGTP